METNLLDKAIAKAVTTTAGAGGDFLPTPLATGFIELIRDHNFCRQLFRTVYMPSKTLDFPKLLSGPSVYYVDTEVQQAPETNITSGTIRLTAKKYMTQIKLSEEVIEDAQEDIKRVVRDEFALALAEAEERAMLTGDPTHTANASTPGAATEVNWYSKDPRLTWNGLVTLSGDVAGTLSAGNRAADRVDASGADMSTLVLRTAKYNLGKYGRVMSDLVIIMNSWSANQLLDDPKLVTLDKYGPKATIFTGEFGKLYGKITCIDSAWMPDGYAVMFPKKNPVIGDRRLVKLKSEDIIEYDALRYVISNRMDFTVEHQDALVQIRDLVSPSDWS